jgi:hypothetical protein
MKAFPLLVIVVSVVTVGGGLYGASTSLRTPSGPPVRPVAVVSGLQAEDHGGGAAVELSAVQHEIELLRAEVHARHSPEADGGQYRKATDTESLFTKLSTELRRLREEVSTLRTQVQQLAAVATPPVVSRDDATAAPPRTAEDLEAMTQARVQRDHEHMVTLDATVQTEAVDQRWSSHTAAWIAQVLTSQELAQTVVSDIECRTTVCRLEVEHADTQEADQFALIFPMHVGGVLPQMRYFHQQLTDGYIHTVIYLARQGHDLPRIAP